jgi:hypothetical protein
MSARIGSVIAPHMGRPLMNLWRPLPSLVFGICATVSGISYLLLPETLGRPLPNTVQQAEALPATICWRNGKKVSPYSCTEGKRKEEGIEENGVKVVAMMPSSAMKSLEVASNSSSTAVSNNASH